MAIFQSVKTDKYTRVVKLFGTTLYKQVYNCNTTERSQNFLGGLITTYKISNIYDYHIEKNVKLLGIPIIKRCENDNDKIWYFLNIPIKKLSLITIFKEKYSKYFDKKYDDIYILNANIKQRS